MPADVVGPSSLHALPSSKVLPSTTNTPRPSTAAVAPQILKPSGPQTAKPLRVNTAASAKTRLSTGMVLRSRAIVIPPTGDMDCDDNPAAPVQAAAVATDAELAPPQYGILHALHHGFFHGVSNTLAILSTMYGSIVIAVACRNS